MKLTIKRFLEIDAWCILPTFFTAESDIAFRDDDDNVRYVTVELRYFGWLKWVYCTTSKREIERAFEESK